MSTNTTADDPTTTPATSVPAGETPAGRCPYCDRPLPTEQLLALHVVESHPDDCTPVEREAAEDARAQESDDLFVYHLKVVAGLVTLWAAFVIAYMVVLGMRG